METLQYKYSTFYVEYEKKCDNNNNRVNLNPPKSFRKYLSNVPAKHKIKELQKTAILGTAHIPSKVLM